MNAATRQVAFRLPVDLLKQVDQFAKKVERKRRRMAKGTYLEAHDFKVSRAEAVRVLLKGALLTPQLISAMTED